MNFFSTIYDAFMFLPERFSLNQRRKHLLKKVSGRVLEVGAGTGVNFQFYSKGVEIIALEPEHKMLEQAQKKIPAGLNITLIEAGIETDQFNEYLLPHSFDFIVLTLVLCTIPDAEASVKRFRHYLKPGGRLIVLEHIRSHGKTEAFFQDKITPYWKKMADGCHLNRNTPELLKKNGFVAEKEHFFRWVIPFYEGVYH